MDATVSVETLIDIDLIDPNPWQPRESEDPEHIARIAESIAKDGLMQIPLGRPAGNRVQLAFGHSRLAAFKLLGQPTMPLKLRDMTDEEMFRLAISENIARKDLSPLEEAQSMERYRSEFGKTSGEIGALFGLSDSAVRNKLRLLNLPEEARAALKTGAMTEGAGRALLPYYALPTETRILWDRRASGNIWDRTNIKTVAEQAIAGEIGAEEVALRVNKMISDYSLDLSGAWWKYDDVLESNDVESLTCRACQFRRENRCLSYDCYREKQRIYEANYIYLASKAIGIKELEADRRGYGEHTQLGLTLYREDLERDNQKATAIISGGCDNLRVTFDDNHEPKKDAVHCVEGYPRAKVVCRNHNGTCRCLAGYDALNGQKHQAPADQPEPKQELTAEQLRQAAADQLKAKRDDNAIAMRLMAKAGELLGKAAAEDYNPSALICLLTMSGIYSASPSQNQSLDQVIHEKARHLFTDNLQYYSLDSWLASANRVLSHCGLPELTREDAGKDDEK